MAVIIPDEVMSIVVAEYIKSKYTPGMMTVKAPSKDDISRILNGFISWAILTGHIDKDLHISIEDWGIEIEDK
jgi:hypothetical protein